MADTPPTPTKANANALTVAVTAAPTLRQCAIVNPPLVAPNAPMRSLARCYHSPPAVTTQGDDPASTVRV